MAYFDLASGAKTAQAGAAAVYTDHLTGLTVDTRGCDTLYCIVNMGTATSSASLTLKMQDGAASNLSDAADITSATFTAMTASAHEGIQVGRLNLTGVNRYVRVYGTYAGSGNIPVSVAFVMGVSDSNDATTPDFNLIP